MKETLTKSGEETIGNIDLDTFLRRENRLRVVGVLSPIIASHMDRKELDQQVIVIGRDPHVEFTLQDESVSRRHAQIYRSGSEYVLEDLGSSNGTYVDGVPIVSCLLQSGDSIQIGRNLFFFDRLLEHIDSEDESQL